MKTKNLICALLVLFSLNTIILSQSTSTLLSEELKQWIVSANQQEQNKELSTLSDAVLTFEASEKLDGMLLSLENIVQLLAKEQRTEDYTAFSRLLGAFYNTQLQNYQAAKPHLEAALKFTSKSENPMHYLKTLDLITTSYYWLFESEGAMQYAVEGLELARQINNLKYKVTFLQWVGRIFVIQQEWKQAIEYYTKMQALALTTDDAEMKFGAHLNLACASFKSGDVKQALSYLNICKKYLDETAENIHRQADFWTWEGIMRGANEEYRESERILNNVIYVYDTLNIPNRRMHTRLELGRVLLKQKKYNKGVKIIEDVLEIDPEHLTAFEKKFAYGQLYTAYGEMKQFEIAFNHRESYRQVVAQLDSINNAKHIQELEKKYREKEQQQIIEQQEIQIEKRKWLGIALGLMSLFLLTALYIVYFLHQNRQKLARQNLLIETQSAELRQLDQFKSSFFANISHEFRTPLTVILGMTEQRNNYPDAMKLIKENGKKLLHLINQLLDLSKIEAKKLELHYKQVEIVSFIRYAGESFHSLAAAKAIKLLIYSEIKELWMDVEEEKLLQVISNLLSNAIKFTPESGEIFLHLAQQEENIVIKVTDTGMGIAAAELPHVFDRFYQGDPNHPYKVSMTKGTGIGLSLTKELVELMGGNIQVKSQVQKGTTFEFHLPITHEAREQATQYPSILMDRTIAAPSKFDFIEYEEDLPRLLIVEDSLDVIKYLGSTLSKTFKIYTAADGAEGIEKATELVPDIIISDVMMPKKDGFELVDILKKDARTSHIPIILLTARATQEDRILGLKQGADAYLTKPFDEKELRVRLEKLIELRRILQEKYVHLLKNGVAFDQLPEQDNTLNTAEAEFLERIRTEVIKRLHEHDFGVSKLAESLHLSQMQVYRKLKALTGQTPSLFIRLTRLQEARQLLENGDLNISEVAYEVGFSDPNYFSRSFQKEFGTSPSDFKSKLKIS
ncbi:MAG: ATP-binding protein [Bacteroidota bacterium]